MIARTFPVAGTGASRIAVMWRLLGFTRADTAALASKSPQFCLRALTKTRRQGAALRCRLAVGLKGALPSRFRAAWRPRKRARAVKSRTRRFAPASDDLSGSPEKKPWSLDPRRFGLGQRLASVPGGSRRRNAHEPSARTQCNFQPGPSED